MITKTQGNSMYIMTLLSDRFRPLWSTHIATCHIDIASNTGYPHYYIAHPLVFCPQDKPTALWSSRLGLSLHPPRAGRVESRVGFCGAGYQVYMWSFTSHMIG